MQYKRDGIFCPIPCLLLPAAAKEMMSQNIPMDARSEQGYLPAGTGPQSSGQDLPHLMFVISFLMESETVREWPASTDHCGGSLGLTARERAVWMRPAELSSMVLAEETMGSMALRPCTGSGWAGELCRGSHSLTLEQPLKAQGLLPPPQHPPQGTSPALGLHPKLRGRHSSFPPCYSQATSLPAPAASHLWADLGRNGGKLRVGGKGCQVIHGLYERGSGGTAPLPVLLVEFAIQGLVWRDQSSYPAPTRPQITSPPRCPGRDRTLMVFTRLAVLLATSLADWTNWRLATGLAVREEARRHVLHRAEVCFATMVAADSTCGEKQDEAGSTMAPHPRSSPFASAQCGAPVSTEVPLGTQGGLPRSCTPIQPPSLDCHHCTRAASWFPVQLMGPDETLAIILANSWDAALK